MGEFVCRVADANGRVFSHIEAAGTLEEARQKLAERGLYVYSVEARSSLVSGMLGVRKQRKIGGNDFLILNQQFNTLIKTGLPILRALDLLATRASAPKLRPTRSGFGRQPSGATASAPGPYTTGPSHRLSRSGDVRRRIAPATSSGDEDIAREPRHRCNERRLHLRGFRNETRWNILFVDFASGDSFDSAD